MELNDNVINVIGIVIVVVIISIAALQIVIVQIVVDVVVEVVGEVVPVVVVAVAVVVVAVLVVVVGVVVTVVVVVIVLAVIVLVITIHHKYTCISVYLAFENGDSKHAGKSSLSLTSDRSSTLWASYRIIFFSYFGGTPKQLKKHGETITFRHTQRHT